MKQKSNLKSLIALLIISLICGVACSGRGRSPSVQIKSTADSIQIYFYRMAFMNFSAISAMEFTSDLPKSPIVIRDTTTINFLENGKEKLKFAKDSNSTYLDTRVMLIFYHSNKSNDSLFVSAMPSHAMQLNQQIALPDSLFWIDIRNLISEKDSTFRIQFQQELSYY